MDMKISPSSQAADDCTALGCATVARTEAKLLIVCGISGGRVLAQDGIRLAVAHPDSITGGQTPL